MRKHLCLGIAALAALSFSACQKAVEVPVVDDSDLVTVTFTSDRAGVETRAAAVEGESYVTYLWTETDLKNFRIFSVSTEEVEQDGETVQKETLTEIQNPVLSLSSDNKVLSVTAKVKDGATVRAAVASEWTHTDPTSPKPRLVVSQNSLASNMDPAADVLVSEDVTVSGNSGGKLVFHRPVTVNKMTLKGLFTLDNVQKVVINSDKDLTGYYSYISKVMIGQGKELTIHFPNGGVVKDTELFPVYFVAIPNEEQTFTLTVDVVRDSKLYRYVKNFKRTVNLTNGKFALFTADLSGLGEEVETIDWSGDWVLVGTDQEHTFAATKNTGNYFPANEVTVDGDVVTVNNPKENYKVTFTMIKEGNYEGRYTIVDATGKYISGQASTNNYLAALEKPSDSSYWLVDKNADGTFNINADFMSDTYRKSMRANWNNGAPRISCYKMDSPQPRITLYPYDKVVENIPQTGTFKTVADLNGLLTSETLSYSGSLKNAVVSFVPTSGVAIIKDATGSIMYYKSNHKLKQGQTFSGDITVDAQLYRGWYSEITDIGTAQFTGNESVIEPATVTLSDLVGHYAEYQNAYVKVVNLTVKSHSGKEIKVTDGKNDYVVLDNLGQSTCIAGDVISAVGTVTKYSETEEVKVWSADDLTVVSKH